MVRPIRAHNLDLNDQIDSRLNQSEQLERYSYLVQLTQEKTNNIFSIYEHFSKATTKKM